MSTLSEYNNNPGNIRPPGGKANFYEGQIGVDENGFAVFANKDFGRKALIQDIRAKRQQGINTPHAFIDRYAPAGKENSEDSRDNYKLSLATGLGLRGTGDPFPPGSEEKIADLITAFEGRSAPAQNQQEPTVTNPFSQPIPGLQGVLSAPPPPPPPPGQEPPEEVISPAAGAAIGAATSAVGQIPFTPEVPQKVDLTGAQTKADVAQSKAELAQQRLQERTGQYEAARQAQVEAEARMAPKTPAGVPAAPVAPSGAPVAGAPEGAPVVELGEPGRYGKATGPGSMVYNYARVAGVPEIEAGQALGMGKGEGEVYDLLERRRRGITEAQTRFPSEGWQENPLFGGLMTRDVTPKASYVAGAEGLRELPAAEAVPAKLTQEQELAQRQADQAEAERRLAETQEMERIKNEAALAKRGATRAQTVAEARKTRAEEAQIDLAAARKAAPGPVAQALRPAEVTGAKAGQTGFTRRAIAGGVLGAYGTMSLNELMDRYNKGERDPELIKALMAAGASGAAVLPAVGPKTARLKGAGMMAAVPLMGYDLYKAIADEEKRLKMENELQRRAGQIRDAVR